MRSKEKTVLPYDYATLSSLRSAGKTWAEIGRIYHKHYTVVMRKFKSNSPVKKNISESNLSNKNRLESVSSRSSDPGCTKREDIVAQLQQKNIKKDEYGSREPTGFISSLNHDEWIEKYCGEGYIWRIDYLTEMRKTIWASNRILVLEPRGHGKTRSCIALFVRFILEVQKPILVITAGAGNAKRIYREIKRLLRSSQVREDYGDVIINFNFTMGEIYLLPELQRLYIDPVFKIIGRGGEIIGLHPIWIHLEDIIQEEFKSNESNESLREWFNEVVNYCAINETRITVTGTRKGIDDFYHFLLTQNFDCLHRSAIELTSGSYPGLSDCTQSIFTDANGLAYTQITDIDYLKGEFRTLGCPNWSLKRLLISRILNLSSFESQMQNNPLPSTGLYFDSSTWVEIPRDKYSHNSYKDYYIAVDPAYGTSKKADNTAILVVAIIPPKLVILDGMCGHMSFVDLEQALVAFNNQYKPHMIFVETNFLQIWLSQYSKSLGLPTVEVKQIKNKIMRIDSLAIHYNEKRIEILSECPIKHDLYREFVQYDQKPSDDTKKDDLLDTLATMFEHLSAYITNPNPAWM